MNRSLRRRLCLGAVAAAAAVTFAAPAYAAAPTVTIGILDAKVAAGVNEASLNTIAFSDQKITVHKAQVTFELSGGLDGAALVDFNGDCRRDALTKLTCDWQQDFELGPDSLSLPSPGAFGVLSPGLYGLSNIKVGQTGTVTMTFAAHRIAKVTKTAKVTIVENVDLAAGSDAKLSVEPGSTFDETIQVINNSKEVVHGAAVTFTRSEYGIAAPKQFSNCLYRDGEVNACTFDRISSRAPPTRSGCRASCARTSERPLSSLSKSNG